MGIIQLMLIALLKFLWSKVLMVDPANQLFSKEGSDTYRLELIRLALRLTSKVPVFGVGLNLSPYYLATSFPQENNFIDPAHPHNLLIQALTETGVVGLAIFSLCIYLIARPVILNRKKNQSIYNRGSDLFCLSQNLSHLHQSHGNYFLLFPLLRFYRSP